MKDKISIAIPVHNVEKYISKCLDSVINQTYKDLEIFCIDDCGTDDSMKIVKEYAKKDNRIKILKHNKNRGQGPAKNTAMDEATGKYFFTLDSDDYLDENYLETLLKIIKKEKSDVVIGNVKVFLGDSWNDLNAQKHKFNTLKYFNNVKKLDDSFKVKEDNLKFTLENMTDVVWGKLYNLSFIKKNNIRVIDENNPNEDCSFTVKFLANCPKISVCNDVYVHYRISATSAMGKIAKNSDLTFLLYMNEALENGMNYINNQTGIRKNIKTIVDNYIKNRLSQYNFQGYSSPDADNLIEMKENDIDLLKNAINKEKPKKILEIGVSAGGSSVEILKIIKNYKNTKLISVDKLKYYYRNPFKRAGFMVKEKCPELESKHTLLTGKDISGFIEEIGNDVDFTFLDTMHVHPVETLNFLTILPFLKKDSYLALHDIRLYYYQNMCYANKYIYDSWIGEKEVSGSLDDFIKTTEGQTEEFYDYNLGILRIENIEENKKNLFSLLFNKWDMDIDDEDIESIRKIIEKYYTSDELYLFDKGVAFGKASLISNNVNHNTNNSKLNEYHRVNKNKLLMLRSKEINTQDMKKLVVKLLGIKLFEKKKDKYTGAKSIKVFYIPIYRKK